MVTQDSIFDLWDILVNELVGSPTLFFIIGLILILVFGITYKLPNSAIIMLATLFTLALAFFIPIIAPFVILGIAGFVGWQISRLIQR